MLAASAIRRRRDEGTGRRRDRAWASALGARGAGRPFARASVRVTLRQMRASHEPLPALGPWLAAPIEPGRNVLKPTADAMHGGAGEQPMRLKDKVAIVVGAGQSPGEGMGNGRATVLRFVQEGATVMAVDRDLASAEETVAMATQQRRCVAFEADVTKEKTLAAMVEAARRRFGRIDVLHYNVGLSIAGGDASPIEITEEAFDRVTAINLRGCVMA